MKKYGKEVVIVLLFALACAALFLLSGETFTLLSDATADRLLQETLARAVTFALLLPVLFLCGCGRSLYGKTTLRALLWCLPCLLVAICNFPFHALLTGAAHIGRTDLLWLFALNCLGVGPFCAMLANGIFTTYLTRYFRDVLFAEELAAGSALAGSIETFLTLFPILSAILIVIGNLVAGQIVERTRTKAGKARPWILLSAVLLAVSGMLIFIQPSNDPTFKMVWLVIAYNLYCRCLPALQHGEQHVDAALDAQRQTAQRPCVARQHVAARRDGCRLYDLPHFAGAAHQRRHDAGRTEELLAGAVHHCRRHNLLRDHPAVLLHA